MEDAVKPTPPPTTDEHAVAGTEEDLISALYDDLLLRILGLVAVSNDARALVRTGALSRRWRGLWTRAPALRLAWTPPHEHDRTPERLIAYVNDALASRARPHAAALELLDISLAPELGQEREQHLPPDVAAAAARWVRYAAQNGVKSFRLKMSLPIRIDDSGGHWPEIIDADYDPYGEGEGVISLEDLPSSARLEALCLELDLARVRLPAAAVLASLVDLTLESVAVQDDGGGHLIACLLSSACCPRLQKLCLRDITHDGVKKGLLLVEAPALTDLTLDEVLDARSLRLITPRLRVLRVLGCYSLEEIAVSAMRLEEITFLDIPRLMDVHGDLSFVSSLVIRTCASVHDRSGNDFILGISLLQRCKMVRCLDVSLYIPQFIIYHGESYNNVDMIKDRIPQLPQVTYLKLHILFVGWKQPCYVDSTASLLAKFTNLRYLHLSVGHSHFDMQPVVSSSISGTLSDLVCGHWRSFEFSSVHLQELKLEVTGTDCELEFLQFLLAGVTQLRNVVLRFHYYWYTEPVDHKNGDFHHRLLGHGIWTWTGCRSCEWTPR